MSTMIAIDESLQMTGGAEPALDAVICVGVSHRTASLALRERLAVSPATLAATLARFGCGITARPSGVSELVVLSTCNRFELYAAGGPDAEQVILALITECTGVDRYELEEAAYVVRGAAVVHHLCRVAAGLESMIIGEPQILGQVANAYSQSLGQGAAGHTLSTLFRGAIRAGRRARNETGINRNAATVASAAVDLVRDSCKDITQATVVVVGAGEMARSTISALNGLAVGDLRVVNRTREHVTELSELADLRVEGFERLPAMLADADVVITSTSAPHHVIDAEMVANAMHRRAARPMVIVDIAVPRDVDPAVTGIANVRYVDLDTLQRCVNDTLLGRASEIPRVEAIIDEEANTCITRLQQLDVEPLISDLRCYAESVRQAALTRSDRYFSHLTDQDREHIEALSESIVNRLLHHPTIRLRAEACSGRAAGYAMAVRELFGLMG